MRREALHWSSPILVAELADAPVPTESGVYVFTEYYGTLQPNSPVLHRTHPGFQAAVQKARAELCVLYVGLATHLRERLRGYLFRAPDDEVDYRANEHKGRAL